MKVTGSIQLRNHTYHMMVRYEDGSGTSRQKSKSTGVKEGISAREKKKNLRIAEVLLEDWIEEIKEGGLTPKRDFMTAIDAWVASREGQVRESTFQAYQSYVKHHIEPYWGKRKKTLDDISVRDVQGYVDYEHKKGLSTASIKKFLTIVNGAFDDAIRYGELKMNPCSKIKYPKGSEFRGKTYSAEQATVLLNGAKGDPVEAALMLALYLGLRRSEIAGLRWKDVDFDDNVVHIRNTVVRFSKLLEEEHTKSKASRRDLYLPPSLKEYLLTLKNEQACNRRMCGNTFQNSDHICQHKDGRSQSPDYIYYRYKRLQKTLGLPDIRLHDLRHTAGSLLINNGVSVKHVQEFLGHEKSSTTLDIYTHVDHSGRQKTAETMDSLLANPLAKK